MEHDLWSQGQAVRRLGFYQRPRLEGKGGTNICTKRCGDAELAGGSAPKDSWLLRASGINQGICYPGCQGMMELLKPWGQELLDGINHPHTSVWLWELGEQSLELCAPISMGAVCWYPLYLSYYNF